MNKHPQLLSTGKDIEELADVLKGAEIIGFDTEFIRESTFYPIVEIIQIATASESWLVDAAAFKKGFKAGPQSSYDPGIEPLLEIFRDTRILKILHAAQGDQECLYTSFGTLAAPIFDTAVGASLSGFGEAIGLGKLVKAVAGETIAKGHARTNWSVRPLPPQLLEYAHADVEFLVQVGRSLLQQLEGLGRKDWALELSAKFAEKSLYETDLEAMVSRLARGGRLDRKGFAALAELIQWREARVRHLNLPRRWIADDTVLVDLAHVRPKDLQHLGSFRGLNKGELRNSGEDILRAIRTGLDKAESVSVPKVERVEAPSIEESQILDVLKCYVGILAERHRIAARHLMTAAQLLALLREPASRPEDLVARGILGAEAARLIGGELIAFIQGRCALYVRDGRIQVAPMDPSAQAAQVGRSEPSKP